VLLQSLDLVVPRLWTYHRLTWSTLDMNIESDFSFLLNIHRALYDHNAEQLLPLKNQKDTQNKLDSCGALSSLRRGGPSAK